MDATGATLGYYTGSVTLVNVGNDWFSVFAVRDGFSSPSSGLFFQYLTPDCTGRRYGGGGGPGTLVPNAQVLAQQAWFVDFDGPSEPLTGTPEAPAMFWVQQVGPGGPVSPCFPSQVFGTVTLFPMRSVDLSAFVPPFRVTD